MIHTAQAMRFRNTVGSTAEALAKERAAARGEQHRRAIVEAGAEARVGGGLQIGDVIEADDLLPVGAEKTESAARCPNPRRRR
jgi:hypothetical protein